MARDDVNREHSAAANVAAEFACRALASGRVNGVFRLTVATQDGTLAPPLERWRARGLAAWDGRCDLTLANDHQRREALNILACWLYIMKRPGEHCRVTLTVRGAGGRLTVSGQHVTWL